MKRTLAFAALALIVAAHASAQWGGSLRFCLRSEPKTFQPLEVNDEASETVRYLTAGTLIRINRYTQELEPNLALSWKVSEGGAKITFRLRQDVRFSDGSPFSAADVAYTVKAINNPALHSSLADVFRGSGGEVKAEILARDTIAVRFTTPLAGMERLFDDLPILSSSSPLGHKAVLGPFVVGEYKPGLSLQLDRNPNYWKTGPGGRRLPYLDAIRLDIQQNREIELLRFRRGEVHLINKLEPEYFERLMSEDRAAAQNAGPSFESEQIWFNQVTAAPIPEYKKAWFRSKNFRNAVSHLIRREDLVKIAFQSLAAPAAGPVSPANRFWFNHALKPRAHDAGAAQRLLAQDGFRKNGNSLVDSAGHPVEFTIVTNSGNKTRARMAALIQQDLAPAGIEARVVTLDFPSLIERITRTYQYDACLLGLVNVDLDPNGQRNIWLSSSGNHQWNPSQKSPETPWEAEIDRLMQTQAATLDNTKRKVHFDRVQQIAWDQEPFLYLVYKNALAAVAGNVRNAKAAVLYPHAYWNADQIQITTHVSRVSR
jgi:peptide/nickel transport system substrate-binding protein